MMGCSSHAQRSGHRWVFKGKLGTVAREYECDGRSCCPRSQREREGWAMDVVNGNLQSLCNSAVMSTINKRNVVH